MMRKPTGLLAPAIGILGLVTVLSTLGTIVTAESSRTDLRRLDPVLRQEVTASRVAATAPSNRVGKDHTPPAPRTILAPLTQDDPGDPRFACWIRLADGISLPPGIEGRQQGSNLVTARLTLAEIEQLLEEPGVLAIEAARRSKPTLDISVPEIQADIVHLASGSPPSYAGYSGAGVVIGVVDTGVDLTHSDFADGPNSRIEFLWDQTVSTVSPPAGFPYGREWTKAQIDGGLATETDSEGHGTHVLGTAGGNGAATGMGEPAFQYIGIAPEAHLVVVKTDFFTSSIVDAVDYVFQKADLLGLPAVVNLSLGHHYGPHDGTELTDLSIDALCGPGRIVVAAAGNEQDDGIHAEAAVASGETGIITFSIPPYSATPGSANDLVLIDGYYPFGQTVEVTLRTPSGQEVGPLTPGNSVEVSTTDGWVILENDFFDPITDDKNIYVQIYDKTLSNTPAPGVWTLFVENTTPSIAAGIAQVDLWLYTHTLSSAPVFVSGMTATKLVSSPATADSVIAVGAYVTRKSWTSVDGNNYGYSPAPVVGSIANFSSHGPRRDGVIKPDIAAPGMGIAAALSTDSFVSNVWIVADGQHTINQGTSMAAPHVAGLVALMLQLDPNASKVEILEQMQGTARTDAFTGNVPNSTWGGGKIDALGATSSPTPVYIAALNAYREVDGITIEWSVPLELGGLWFHLERTVDGGPIEFVANVGPGPSYSFTDDPFLESEDVAYWLTGLEGGESGERIGPYYAEWFSDRPDFSLSRAAPNPFSNGTRWNLYLPTDGRLRMVLLDATGRVVHTLTDDRADAGSYAVEWDGRTDHGNRAASGLYWMRCSWNGKSLTDKVLLLRSR